MKWCDIEKEVQNVKNAGATKIRVLFLRNPQKPQVISIMEFLPEGLNKGGSIPAIFKRQVDLEDAEYFRVDDISSV